MIFPSGLIICAACRIKPVTSSSLAKCGSVLPKQSKRSTDIGSSSRVRSSMPACINNVPTAAADAFRRADPSIASSGSSPAVFLNTRARETIRLPVPQPTSTADQAGLAPNESTKSRCASEKGKIRSYHLPSVNPFPPSVYLQTCG